MLDFILVVIVLGFILVIFPELLIIPLILMEFILRLFGKSFDDTIDNKNEKRNNKDFR